MPEKEPLQLELELVPQLALAPAPTDLKTAEDGGTDLSCGHPLDLLSTELEEEGDESAAEDERQDGTTEDDDRQDGGYGWVIVVCSLALNACTWGINTTYGVYTAYYLEYNYYSASQMDYAWVGGLSAAMSNLSGPLANFLIGKLGFKGPMLIGASFIGLGQCLAGICTSFGPFLVCQGIIFGLGVGLIAVPSQPVLAHWFHRRLALAQGIAQSGSGIGGLIFANTTPLLLLKLGVKWTLVINGCISMAVLFPAVLLMKGQHQKLGARNAPLQISFLWHPGFRYVVAWACFTSMAYYIAIYSFASYATDALGLSQTQGGAIQSILAAGQIIGRPMWGVALDLGGRVNMVIVSYIVCTVGTLGVWLPARSFGVLAFAALLQGMTGGTVNSTSTPLATTVVGVQDLGSALSIYWLSLAIPSVIGQPIAIALVDHAESHLGKTGPDAYTSSIGLCGGLFMAGALALVGLKRRLQGNWKIFKKA